MASSDDSSEVAGELDDALNELGMLAAVESKNQNREFIKGKWSAAGRRGYPLRYPLRREKEREISWCSGSSSSSSTGILESAVKFYFLIRRILLVGGILLLTRSYSRSSLISSYSIAETPTGNAPIGTFGSSSGTVQRQPPLPPLAYGKHLYSTRTSTINSRILTHSSSVDLMDQAMSGVTTCISNFKSVDFPKVLRRVHHQSYKPYNLGKPSRRFSLQLGIHQGGAWVRVR